MSRVYVRNLLPAVSEQDLDDEFSIYGKVKNVWIAKRPPGYGYVEFDDSRHASNAIRELDGKHDWHVELCNSQEGGDSVGDVSAHRSPEIFFSRKRVKRDEIGPNELEKSVSEELLRLLKMYASSRKIQKANGDEPTEFEESVAQTNAELAGDLKDLYIDSAIQLDVSESLDPTAVLIQYPYNLREGFRRIRFQLERELEKKLPGNVVVLIPIRRKVPKQHKVAAQEVILRDVIYPAEIVVKCGIFNFNEPMEQDVPMKLGKYDNTLYPVFTKYFLHSKAKEDTEYKLEAFASIFRFLCGKDVGFVYTVKEFP